MIREQKNINRQEKRKQRAIKNRMRNDCRWRRNGGKNDCPYDVDMNGIYGSCRCGGEKYESCLGDI